MKQAPPSQLVGAESEPTGAQPGTANYNRAKRHHGSGTWPIQSVGRVFANAGAASRYQKERYSSWRISKTAWVVGLQGSAGGALATEPGSDIEICIAGPMLACGSDTCPWLID